MKRGFWRAILVAVGTATVILLAVWFFFTQPLLPPLPASSRELYPIPDRLALTRHVYAISGPLSPRSWRHEENLEDTAGYIATEWERAKMEAQQQTFSTTKGEFKNVFVNLGPDTEEVIVVGAHYDAHGAGSGADDNASGVAGIIELAKMLQKVELKKRVIVIGYSIDGPPHFSTNEMGSAAHASALQAANKKVIAMISVEMIGYFHDEAGSQEFPLTILPHSYPDTGNFIAVASNLANIGLTRRVKRSMREASDLSVLSINAPGLTPGIDFSDHRNYWAQGFPALMITDTAFFRNKSYRDLSDTPERLDYRRMQKVVAGIFRATLDLANGEGYSLPSR